MNWRDDAACLGKTELMYGPYPEAPEDTKRRVSEAMALCQSCPVMLECRIDAAISRAYVEMGCVAGAVYWPIRGARHGQWAMAVLDGCPCAKCESRRQSEEVRARRPA